MGFENFFPHNFIEAKIIEFGWRKLQLYDHEIVNSILPLNWCEDENG